MKAKFTSLMDISPKQMAEVLCDGTPEEFADVWLEVYRKLNDNQAALDEWAKALSPQLGGGRLIILRRLLAMAEYHHENRKRAADHS